MVHCEKRVHVPGFLQTQFCCDTGKRSSQCASKMACQRETYSKGEIRETPRFLWAKRLNYTDIHREILAVYGPNAISRPAIVKWCQQVDQGRTDLNDGHRAGRPSTSTTDGIVQAIEEMVRSNRRVTVAEIAEQMRISIGSAHSIVRDRSIGNCPHTGFRDHWHQHIKTKDLWRFWTSCSVTLWKAMIS